MDYHAVVERDKPEGGILPFLDQCFHYLEEKALTTTGLFRVSAPKPQLDALREKIDKGTRFWHVFFRKEDSFKMFTKIGFYSLLIRN